MTTLETLPPIRLTELTDCGGCAAKLGADLLAEALTGLGAETAPAELIAGLAPPDDAAAYRISPELAIIGTLDFFPPLVDDARTYGEIAAANALSRRVRDGRPGAVRAVDRGVPRGPATGHPGGDLRGCLGQGARGGRHARRRPHHPRPRAEVRPRGDRRGAPRPAAAQRRCPARRPAAADEAARDRRARVGLAPGPDRSPRTSPPAVDQMRTLNRAASEVLLEAGIAAATDVTGFGLLGHGLEMARASGARFVFDAASLPVLGRRAGARRRRRRDRRCCPQPALRRRCADRRGRHPATSS